MYWPSAWFWVWRLAAATAAPAARPLYYQFGGWTAIGPLLPPGIHDPWQSSSGLRPTICWWCRCGTAKHIKSFSLLQLPWKVLWWGNKGGATDSPVASGPGDACRVHMVYPPVRMHPLFQHVHAVLEHAVMVPQRCLSKAHIRAFERHRCGPAAAGPPDLYSNRNTARGQIASLAVLEQGGDVAAHSKTAKLAIRPRVCCQ